MSIEKLMRREHKELAALEAQRADLAAKVATLTTEVGELTKIRDAIGDELRAVKLRMLLREVG